MTEREPLAPEQTVSTPDLHELATPPVDLAALGKLRGRDLANMLSGMYRRDDTDGVDARYGCMFGAAEIRRLLDALEQRVDLTTPGTGPYVVERYDPEGISFDVYDSRRFEPGSNRSLGNKSLCRFNRAPLDENVAIAITAALNAVAGRVAAPQEETNG